MFSSSVKLKITNFLKSRKSSSLNQDMTVIAAAAACFPKPERRLLACSPKFTFLFLTKLGMRLSWKKKKKVFSFGTKCEKKDSTFAQNNKQKEK